MFSMHSRSIQGTQNKARFSMLFKQIIYGLVHGLAIFLTIDLKPFQLLTSPWKNDSIVERQSQEVVCTLQQKKSPLEVPLWQLKILNYLTWSFIAVLLYSFAKLGLIMHLWCILSMLDSRLEKLLLSMAEDLVSLFWAVRNFVKGLCSHQSGLISLFLWTSIKIREFLIKYTDIFFQIESRNSWINFYCYLVSTQ